MAERNPQRPCPICGRLTTYLQAPVGPFCSPRCHLVDLGKWLGEDYRISEPLRPEHFTGPDDDED